MVRAELNPDTAITTVKGTSAVSRSASQVVRSRLVPILGAFAKMVAFSMTSHHLTPFATCDGTETVVDRSVPGWERDITVGRAVSDFRHGREHQSRYIPLTTWYILAG